MRTLAFLALLALPTAAAIVTLPGADTIAIAGYEPARAPGRVILHVDVAGTALRLGEQIPSPIVGEVEITSPTPCWSDWPGACADVLHTQTVDFRALPEAGGAWAARVGPFSWPAGLGPSCERLHVVARATSGVSEVSARDDPTICV